MKKFTIQVDSSFVDYSTATHITFSKNKEDAKPFTKSDAISLARKINEIKPDAEIFIWEGDSLYSSINAKNDDVKKGKTKKQENLILKGSHNLIFEFKKTFNPNGTDLKFIRYREGEREFARSEYIFLSLLSKRDREESKEIEKVIVNQFRSYSGFKHSMISKIVDYYLQPSEETF